MTPTDALRERLKRVLPYGDEAEATIDEVIDIARSALSLAERQQAEIEGMREALQSILALSADRERFVMLGPRAFIQCENIARAAIAQQGSKP